MVFILNVRNNEFRRVINSVDFTSQSVEERDHLLQVVYDEVERDMELLGATGVEDQLQEEVALTLESLRVAGVKVNCIYKLKIISTYY